MYNRNTMFYLPLYLVNIVFGFAAANYSIWNTSQIENVAYFKGVFNEVYGQNPFNTILIALSKKSPPNDARIEYILHIDMPKIILRNQHEFPVRPQFNKLIYAVAIMEDVYDEDLLLTMAKALQDLRQIRILILAFNITATHRLRSMILDFCQDQKFTNVLLKFLNTDLDINAIYYQLQPYPKYNFIKRSWHDLNQTLLYPQHWRNMHGKVLHTLPDQLEPLSMVYTNGKQGKQIISGYIGRLILSFARTYNATLKFPYPIKVGEVMHIEKISNLTNRGILDMGISLYYMYDSTTWQHLSYPVELSKWLIMVPCPKLIPLFEVFAIVFNWRLYLTILLMMVILSFMQSITKIMSTGSTTWINFIINDHVLPGILGQSVNLQLSSSTAMQFIYLDTFLLGLFIAALYSAELKTLIATPSYRSQINTFEELRLSKQKILLDVSDRPALDSHRTPEFNKQIDGLIIYTSDTASYQIYRKHFNTSNCYSVTEGLWEVLQRQQNYFHHKVFCMPKDIHLLDTMLMAIPLPENSPYKEAIDHFVHLVHETGLLIAWQAETFHDMVRLGKFPLIDTSIDMLHEPLTIHDLYWIWLLLVKGLFLSSLAFAFELLISKLNFNYKNHKFKWQQMRK